MFEKRTKTKTLSDFHFLMVFLFVKYKTGDMPIQGVIIFSQRKNKQLDVGRSCLTNSAAHPRAVTLPQRDKSERQLSIQTLTACLPDR